MRSMYPDVRVIVDTDSREFLRFDLGALTPDEREWKPARRPNAHEYLPQAKIVKPLKTFGRRADFVKFCGFGKDNAYKTVMDHFHMSRANVAAFLRFIHKDHGIGFVNDGMSFRLVLPAGVKPASVWRRD